jgi:hypothetical protein
MSSIRGKGKSHDQHSQEERSGLIDTLSGIDRAICEERDENNLPFPAISRVGGHYAQSGSDLRSLVAASSWGERAVASRRTPK